MYVQLNMDGITHNKALLLAAVLMHSRVRMPMKHLSDEEFICVKNAYNQINSSWVSYLGETK